MQILGTEITRYVVPPAESGLGYPLQVIIYQPRNEEAYKAKVLSFEMAEAYAVSDDAVTWEDAAWQ